MHDHHTPLFEEKTLQFLQEILENPPKSEKNLEERKNAFAKEHGISTLKNRDLVVVAQKNNLEMPEQIAKLIQKRSVRTISGVSPIGILTKPFDCPGKCIYCPTEDRMPKSYMSNQPAAARAVRNHFHPFLQVKNRIISLEESGHPVSKLEVIVMGGTWSFLPTAYQQWYIKKIFEAANSFDSPLIKGVGGIENSKFKIQNESVGAKNFSPENLEIREIISDIEKEEFVDLAWNQMHKEFGRDKYSWQSLTKVFSFWGAFYDKKLVATAALEKEEQGYALNFVSTHEKFRRKGIGKMLISKVFEHAKEKNITECRIGARKNIMGLYMFFNPRLGNEYLTETGEHQDLYLDLRKTIEKNNFEPKKATTPEQKLACFEFLKKIWKEEFDLDMEKFREVFLEKHTIFFCEKNAEIIGVVELYENPNKQWKLNRMGVDMKFRGQKMGEILMEKIITFLHENEVEKPLLTDALSSQVGFYEKFGFVKTSEIQDLIFNPKIQYFSMEKSMKEISLWDKILLKEEQQINETTSHRVIGLTLETRPDWITEKELVKMRNYGCTRIEIGVQTLDDEVQKLTQRGHNRKHVIKAMKLMKDFGFKVCFHLMPGLPGSTPEKDIAWIKEVFEDENFRPDFIKIYPCVVLETAELKKWWEEGKYVPYDDATLIKLLVQLQTVVPEYCRIMRLMRDIPVQNILGGAKFSNLRQILHGQPEKLKEIVGEKFFEEHDLANTPVLFKDIRSKEIGFANPHPSPLPKGEGERMEPVLKRRDYNASEGKEVFLSFETQDEQYLFALLRLRKPSNCPVETSIYGVSGKPDAMNRVFPNALQNAALIREVHSYGTEISIGDESGGSTGQHKGLGKKLLLEAEKIAKEEWGMEKISIIAGIGTREYYRKFGYEECETYMTKIL